MRVPVKRCLLDYPLVYIPSGLLTFALVAILSTIWPPKRPRDPGSIT